MQNTKQTANDGRLDAKQREKEEAEGGEDNDIWNRSRRDVKKEEVHERICMEHSLRANLGPDSRRVDGHARRGLVVVVRRRAVRRAERVVVLNERIERVVTRSRRHRELGADGHRARRRCRDGGLGGRRARLAADPRLRPLAAGRRARRGQELGGGADTDAVGVHRRVRRPAVRE
jgi:hypothetical protein